MSDPDIQFPDVNYGENNREKYNELITSAWSPFIGHPIWEVFIFSMSYAFAKNIKPVDPTGKGTLNSKLFDKHTRHLMRSLAIRNTEDITIIKNSNKVVKICEGYANAGFQEMYARIKNRPTEKPVEGIFRDMINEINRERD